MSAVVLALAAATMDSAAAGAKRPSRQPREPIRTIVSQPSEEEDAFDWLDAAIGGAAVLGIALLASGMSLVVQRSGQQRVLGGIEPSEEQER